MASVFKKVIATEKHIGLKNLFVIDIDGDKKIGDIIKGIQGKIAVSYNDNIQSIHILYVLEEVELPTDKEIDHEGWVRWVKPDPEVDAFEDGIKWILNKLK